MNKEISISFKQNHSISQFFKDWHKLSKKLNHFLPTLNNQEELLNYIQVNFNLPKKYLNQIKKLSKKWDYPGTLNITYPDIELDADLTTIPITFEILNDTPN